MLGHILSGPYLDYICSVMWPYIMWLLAVFYVPEVLPVWALEMNNGVRMNTGKKVQFSVQKYFLKKYFIYYFLAK